MKTVKNSILEVESIKEVRRLQQSKAVPHRSYPIRQRTQNLTNTTDSKRDPSPSLSAVTSHEDYFKEMEAAILSENHNLKEHNQFLKGQIESMFERERKYKSHIASHRERLRQLETLNAHLQQQLQLLINNILREIERIQTIIEEQRDQENSLSKHIFEMTPKNSEACASETESTIHKDLEDLKAKVKEIYNQKYTTTLEPEAPVFHRSEYKSDSSSRFGESRQDILPQPEIRYPEMKAERKREEELEVPASLISKPKQEQRGKKPRANWWYLY